MGLNTSILSIKLFYWFILSYLSGQFCRYWFCLTAKMLFFNIPLYYIWHVASRELWRLLVLSCPSLSLCTASGRLDKCVNWGITLSNVVSAFLGVDFTNFKQGFLKYWNSVLLSSLYSFYFRKRRYYLTTFNLKYTMF